MEGPFNSAWALLKNEQNLHDRTREWINQQAEMREWPPAVNDPYPLTPQEETFYEMEKRAYEMAKNANPQPPNMTDERYDELIEEPAEAILAGMMAKKKRVLNPDYPWPKKHPFQTTFENDGSINRDPKVSEQRKLNARMGRESNRREAVPSRIEISPRDKHQSGRDFSLLNNEGETLSSISGYGGGVDNNPHIHEFYGQTDEPYRRQGMYRKLMQALIGAGIPIKSSERNSQSNPFHQKFLESLPPNIMSSYVDEYGNPRTLHPSLEGMEPTVENLDHQTPLEYHQNKVPQFLDAQGQRSGLNRRDYGAIPIVNQENQARNMDELAEQDRFKIRRGQGHMPETQGILVQQPMARNTTQSRLNQEGDEWAGYQEAYSELENMRNL